MSHSGALLGRDGFYAVLPAPKRRLHAIRDPLRQLVRPLVNGLIGDADCFGSGGYRAPEQINRFRLAHGVLNHSSGAAATIVLRRRAIIESMVEYGERLRAAMRYANADEHAIARELGITYTGVKKALRGGDKGTSAMSAYNNAKVARFLGVSPDWLATGEGQMVERAPWPLPLVDRERFEKLTPEMRGYVQSAMSRAIDDCEQRAVGQGKTRYNMDRIKALGETPYQGEGLMHKTAEQKAKDRAKREAVKRRKA